ncbi:hypothetical protein [Sphingobacterium faecium]|uniref:hypothetical protein n=1 Tax=Sphingobacterium faecium TaxID=34087 RepID=UPI003209D328
MLKDKNYGLGNQIPPDLFYVEIYFLAHNSTTGYAIEFYTYYKEKGWKNEQETFVKNWKILAWQWIYYKAVV